MKHIWILGASHLAVGAAGFAVGVYTLPILTADAQASSADVRVIHGAARYTGEFRRDLSGSDPLHWAQGKVTVANDAIAFEGKVAPGPDYKIYLLPEFVETKEQFLAAQSRAVRVGDLKAFGNFVTRLPNNIDIDRFTTVVIWCERFSRFISAAQYRGGETDRPKTDTYPLDKEVPKMGNH